MGDTLQTTNNAAKNVAATVSDIFSAAIPIAESAIIAAVPFLGIPGLMQIWEMLFKYIVNQLSAALGTQGAYIVMDVQEYFTLKSAATAIAQLKVAQASGDSNAIAQANTIADAAAANFLHYHGDAHP